MPNSGTCDLRHGLFGSCGAAGIGRCQYCGRSFCAEHGEALEDGQEICNSKNCVAKREDLVLHLQYKANATQRNQRSLCGLEGCENRQAGQCARCQCFYCNQHVYPREETILENQVRVKRVASLCQNCQVRRAIWIRT